MLVKFLVAREDLEDLHYNEPSLRENTSLKIDIVDAKIYELFPRVQRLQYCLDNGCDVCYPGSGIPFE